MITNTASEKNCVLLVYITFIVSTIKSAWSQPGCLPIFRVNLIWIVRVNKLAGSSRTPRWFSGFGCLPSLSWNFRVAMSGIVPGNVPAAHWPEIVTESNRLSHHGETVTFSADQCTARLSPVCTHDFLQSEALSPPIPLQNSKSGSKSGYPECPPWKNKQIIKIFKIFK